MTGQSKTYGLDLHKEERGAPDAPPIVLLHGFTGSAAGWGDHLETLSDAGFRVIAFDLPGHGKTDSPDDLMSYDIGPSAEDVVLAAKACGVAPGTAVLLGYSMGGRIALFTAFSGFFRALILESASPGIADPSERADRRASDAALADRIEREGIESFVAHWESLPLFASQRSLPADVRARLHAQRLQNTPRGLANSLRGVGAGSQPYLMPRLGVLSLPVLLLAGVLDAKYTALGRAMAEVLPNAELHIVPDAGHTIHLEQPQIFHDLVIAFCRKRFAS